MTDMKRCDMCGKMKRNVKTQPSRGQLLFGGFRVSYEDRCSECERKTAAWIKMAISNV